VILPQLPGGAKRDVTLAGEAMLAPTSLAGQPPRMGTGRMEAFSDGVIAIIITIMVLELRVPRGADLAALRDLVPVLAGYVLSFIYVAIYWNNHHHLLHACERINGAIMWANLHFLFWLSLVPFVTAWVGDHRDASLPTAFYGFVLLMAGVAYVVLERQMVAENGPQSMLAEAIGIERKGVLSLVAYVAAIVLAFVSPRIADVLYVLVAVMWIVPDPRIASRMRT
jgi:TMEM175 potassium channel family protein